MDDTHFNRGAARRPAPAVNDPMLQWATGLQTRERRIYAGWLAERGRNPEFDSAMGLADFPTVVIKHGNGNIVEHWAIETANMFVIAEGVQSIGEMKHTPERFGIAFGWRQLEGGRMQSQLRARVLLRELLEIGYTDALLLSVKSTLTGDVLAAFNRQFEVLEAINTIRAQDEKPAIDLPFYCCSLPIGPGDEVARGSSGQSKEISPPVVKLPDPIDKEYIKTHWARREWVPAIESRIDETIRWSIQTSRMIAEAETAQPQGDYY